MSARLDNGVTVVGVATRTTVVAQNLIGGLLLSALSLSIACERPGNRAIEIATTTSVQNSGLLNHLLPIFERASGIAVRVHATGSGRALQMLADGSVDLAISHAPEAEERMLAQHADWSYRKIAHNWFVVAGPVTDPAGVRGSTDVLEAFRRIAASDQPFVSRGDQSGTHERELAFWKAAGTKPKGQQLIVSGRGMAQALRHADEAYAYVLTDATTLLQMGSSVDLKILFDGDDGLLNTYAVIHRVARQGATEFAAWLVSADGRAAIGTLMIAGQRGFEPWPDGCVGTKPGHLPCRPSLP